MAENVVNVNVNTEFTAAVLRGVAEQIPDALTAPEIRELLNDLADTLTKEKNNDTTND